MKVMSINYQAANASSLFAQSLKETGFAVLTHHPIDNQLIEKVYSAWQAFFFSTNKEKYLFQRPSQDGYFPLRTESAKNSKISDVKEFFHYYPWGKVPPELKEMTCNIYEVLKNLASHLLTWVQLHLPETINQKLSMPLNQMIADSPNTLLRILHYPPLNLDLEKEAIRAGAHEDINLITLLPAATAPGLQVQDVEGNWHDVTCDPGNIVVNVGDMLQICTQYYYQSTTHRVMNPDQTKNISRFSMPLFLHPHPSVLLTETHTAQDFLHERLKAIGIY